MFRRQPLVTASSALVPNGLQSKRIARTRTEKKRSVLRPLRGTKYRTYCDRSRECRLRNSSNVRVTAGQLVLIHRRAGNVVRVYHSTPPPTSRFETATQFLSDSLFLSGSSLSPLRGRNAPEASARPRQTKPTARRVVLATVPSRCAGSSNRFLDSRVPARSRRLKRQSLRRGERKKRELTRHQLPFAIALR